MQEGAGGGCARGGCAAGAGRARGARVQVHLGGGRRRGLHVPGQTQSLPARRRRRAARRGARQRQVAPTPAARRLRAVLDAIRGRLFSSHIQLSLFNKSP